MRPSSEPEGDITENTEAEPQPTLQLWQMNGECPENTIPIRRTKEEDLLRSTSLESFGKKSYKNIFQVVSSDLSAAIHEYAISYMVTGKFHGSKSFINVWKPFVEQPGEFSLA
ncbi:PREDICTED: uncharacterized protein LOC104817128 [Tarenaya hassleriana]|uniref:uncharacterized protein LOC104817128 n=1 Tax=Tarenaya hassleriana TaxID=28532 RepID=UPI00053C5904|nr:PREDICTED: uncharacterized protein LOC104817128 [Tarenaya hassleriana]